MLKYAKWMRRKNMKRKADFNVEKNLVHEIEVICASDV